MRIGYVIGKFPTLSETFVSREVSALIKAGMDVEIYSFERPGARDVELLSPDALELLGRTQYIQRTEAAAALLSMRALWAVGANTRLSKAATAASHPWLRLGRAAAIARRAARDGVSALHAHWPYASQIVHLVHGMIGLPYSISVHAHEVAHDNGHFATVFERLSFAAFCNRGAMAHLIDELQPVRYERAHLLYHGVDLKEFAPLPWPAQSKPIEILSAGRLTRTKGFDRLIRACDVARRCNLDVRLTILGAGKLKEYLQALARELDFADRLEMPGWVSHGEVRRFMERTHVFALLADTGFHDGLPNVVLEAMASSRPIILSPLPAASEAVTHGEEGFVLKSPHDTQGFLEAIELASRRPERLREMGLSARRRVERDHDAQAQVGKMLDLFRRYAA